MNPVPAQREYFSTPSAPGLMLLGDPFHISFNLLSHTWHVNSAEPSLWLTLLMTSSTRSSMQVFSLYPYFSYMLLRYPLKMVESTCRTCRDPDVNSHPLTDIAAIYYAAIRQRESGKLA